MSAVNERSPSVHQLVHGREPNDVPVQARLSPENLSEVRADGTAISEAFQETKNGGWAGRRRCGHPPLREGDVDGSIVVVLSVGCQGGRDLDE